MSLQSLSEKNVWVDATGFLLFGLQNPTGIQRVEAGLIESALLRDDIGIAILNGHTGQFEAADHRALAYIRFLLEHSRQPVRGSRLSRVTEEFRYLDVLLKFGNNRTARYLAATLTGGRSSNPVFYLASKILIQTLMFILHIFIMIKYHTGLFFRKLEKNDNKKLVILSVDLSHSKKSRKYIKRSNITPVYIIYDLMTIYHPHLFEFHRFLIERFDRVHRSILNKNEITIAISNTVRDELAAWNRDVVKADYQRPFHACKLTSSIEIEKTIKQPVDALMGKTFAMCVSTFLVHKRHFLLVKVWALLANRLGADNVPDLVLVGRKGPGLPAVEAELKAAPHIAHKVHLLHDVSDPELAWCYQNTMLGLFASAAEGWGLALSEFLAHGTPVVHSDIPIFHEVAQGLMPSAPVDDAEKWSDIIEDLLINPQKLALLTVSIAQNFDAGEPDSFARCVFAYLQTQSLAASKNAAVP